MKIKIDNEVYDVERVINHGYLPMVEIGKLEFYVAESSESAGESARKYWEELAETDPKEFACLVGEQTLIQWGMGHSAGPGSTHVRSLQEWLDLWLDTPEENFASYDGSECKVDIEVDETDPNYPEYQELIEELGFTPTVAYRHN